MTSILNQYGKPFSTNGKHRRDLGLTTVQRRLLASYDAARSGGTDGEPSKNDLYFAHADAYDADSANRRDVREKLVRRSRYDIYNNGFSDGIAQTYANDLVGIGPKLRMLSGSQGFNQMVERQWQLWWEATSLRRKLWCMAHAKHSDGEVVSVLRNNPNLRHEVKLDAVLYETEQMQSHINDQLVDGIIDGIVFDQFGNPTFYDILKVHPGRSWGWGQYDVPERVPAEFVLHWFKLRRPGQHRGIPECTSTLGVSGSARRWREATVLAAEIAASHAVLLETQAQAAEVDPIEPMSSERFQHGMQTALPMGWSARQLPAEHPNATNESFSKSLINEQARPKNMPYNKAACDSSDYNYASGRLDHQTYYASLDIDRADGTELVLNRIFGLWFDEAVRTFGWLGGNPRAINRAAISYSFDWPKHAVADLSTEASANDTKLKNGSLTLSTLYSENGLDYADELEKMAADYGVTVEEMRKILLVTHFPAASALLQPATPPPSQQNIEQDEEESEESESEDNQDE